MFGTTEKISNDGSGRFLETECYHLNSFRRWLNYFRKHPDSFWKKLRRTFSPVRQDYQRFFDMTLADWLVYHQTEIVFDKCRWMGVRAAKNPFDSWIYQEILFQVQPDILVEVGSLEGGSTLFFAQLMDLIGKGAVVSVDKDRSNFQIKHPRVTAITGDSSSSEVVRQVSQICAGKSVLVVHDADHRKEQVLMDLSNYSRLVTIGSYLIVEDGIIDLFTPGDGIATFEEGPLSAIEEFLKLNSDFVIDKNCERYILTYNPNGFLKRIR